MTRNLSPCYASALSSIKAIANPVDGTDGVVAHLGATTKGSIGLTTATIIEEAPIKVRGLCDAANQELRRLWAAQCKDCCKGV